jgi:hypothetical protein
MAYVIIVEFRANPDQVAAFAELIDRNTQKFAHARARLPGVRPLPGSVRPRPLRVSRGHRDQAAHRRHLEMDSSEYLRATAPELIVPGSESAPYHRQVLTRQPVLSE